MFELTNEELHVISGGSRASANGRGGRGGDATGGLYRVRAGDLGTISGNAADTTAGVGAAGGGGTAGDTTGA